MIPECEAHSKRLIIYVAGNLRGTRSRGSLLGTLSILDQRAIDNYWKIFKKDKEGHEYICTPMQC